MTAAPGDLARRRSARLLEAILLVMVVVFGLLDLVSFVRVPGYTSPWYGYAFLMAAGLLNRSGRYTAAAGVALSMFPVVILYGVLSGESADPKASLSYFVPGVVLASILLPARRMALFAGVCIGLVLLLPLLAPGAVPAGVASPLALIAVVTGLALLSIRHRNSLEGERQAEREALIQDLAAKNTELERFTYTVSHDLKSPLITVRGFAEMLARNAATGRPEQLQQDAGRILAATSTMGSLLDDLLELSRIGRVANPIEDVSLRAQAEDVCQLLRGRLEQRGVEVSIDPRLPVVVGDRARLFQLLQNLIENAVKFSGTKPHPRIEVGCRDEGSQHVCFVGDNGIGIAPEHHERVFGLFSKLDPDSEGTGIGLALVRRIVEVHGGRAWVESEGEGRGASFCFALPRRLGVPKVSPSPGSRS